jgi:hypothetical protein
MFRRSRKFKARELLNREIDLQITAPQIVIIVC